MSLHIHRFVDAVKAHESRGLKDFQMSLRDAKDLHADITKLLVTLDALRSNSTAANETITVELAGGSFKTA
jgi:hypothetical protein